MPVVEPTFEMWATLLLAAGAIVAYASERVPVELAALGILGALLLLFRVDPGASPPSKRARSSPASRAPP